MRHLTRDDIRIHALLRTTRSIAVVEPARQRGRPGRAVLDYLRAAGFDVIPVRADQAPIEGLTAFASVKGVETVWLPVGRSSRARRLMRSDMGVLDPTPSSDRAHGRG